MLPGYRECNVESASSHIGVPIYGAYRCGLFQTLHLDIQIIEHVYNDCCKSDCFASILSISNKQIPAYFVIRCGYAPLRSIPWHRQTKDVVPMQYAICNMPITKVIVQMVPVHCSRITLSEPREWLHIRRNNTLRLQHPQHCGKKPKGTESNRAPLGAS